MLFHCKMFEVNFWKKITFAWFRLCHSVRSVQSHSSLCVHSFRIDAERLEIASWTHRSVYNVNVVAAAATVTAFKALPVNWHRMKEVWDNIQVVSLNFYQFDRNHFRYMILFLGAKSKNIHHHHRCRRCYVRTKWGPCHLLFAFVNENCLPQIQCKSTMAKTNNTQNITSLTLLRCTLKCQQMANQEL